MSIAIFNVKVDFKDCVQFIDTLKNKQIPYVTAVVLTKLAEGSQWELRRGMGEHFRLRSGDRMRKGIRIEPAKKADFFAGTIHSVVKDIDPFMGIHTTGGDKEANHSRSVAVPKSTLLSRGARTNKGAIKLMYKPKTLIQQMKEAKSALNKRRRTDQGKKPGQKAGSWERVTGRKPKPKPFTMNLGGGRWAIAQRVTKESKSSLVFLFGFYPRTKQTPRWPFADTVAEYCSGALLGHFNYEFNKAINEIPVKAQ